MGRAVFDLAEYFKDMHLALRLPFILVDVGQNLEEEMFFSVGHFWVLDHKRDYVDNPQLIMEACDR